MFKLLKPVASDNMDQTNLITIDNIVTDNVLEEHTSVHNILENKSTLYADANDVGGMY